MAEPAVLRKTVPQRTFAKKIRMARRYRVLLLMTLPGVRYLLINNYLPWLKEVESTVMTKGYKMIVLLYMLERVSVDWIKPITAANAAPFFHHYLTDKEYRKRIDFSDSETRSLWEYNQTKVSKLIARIPMSKWSGSSKGLVIFENGQFSLNVIVLPEELELLWQWTKVICLYRLHLHFERREDKGN